MPPGGDAEGVEWIQSMARITLSYPIEADVNQDDIEIKLTGFQLEVSVQGSKLKALTGELQDLVRSAPKSWWMLSGEAGFGKTLVIQLMKLKHGAWGGPWFLGTLHPKKKGRFWWNEIAKAQAQEEEKVIKLNAYEVLPPGRPAEEDTAWYPPSAASVFSPLSDKYLCSPDDLVLGTNVKQDKRNIYLYIHFDVEALDFFEEQVPYEDFFAADVGPNTVYVFIRGDDQNPIINATFAGLVVAEATTWKMTTMETFRTRQKAKGSPSPALMLTFTKAEGHYYEWPQIFDACWQHRLMVKNQGDYDDMIEAFEQLQWVDETTDPNRRAELQDKADKLQTWQEERFDGIPEAMTYRRSGYDIDSNDYWENVYDYVRETVKSNGCVSAPKVLEVSDM
jgi:hypothetical protein